MRPLLCCKPAPAAAGTNTRWDLGWGANGCEYVRRYGCRKPRRGRQPKRLRSFWTREGSSDSGSMIDSARNIHTSKSFCFFSAFSQSTDDQQQKTNNITESKDDAET